MRPNLQVHPRFEGFVPGLHQKEELERPRSVVMLAPAIGWKERTEDFFRRIDWVAVGAAGFVYTVALAAWLYLAK